jgi:hypothetical protein
VVINLYAQGTVIVYLPPITNILTMMPVAGTAFRVSLYYLPYTEGAPPPTSDQFVTPLRPDIPPPLVPGGVFLPTTRTTPSTTAPGDFAWFQVRAWEAAFGTSYEQAAATPPSPGGRCALIGTSNIVKVRTDGPTSPPGILQQAVLNGFFVAPCPEPSARGLGVLGLGVLALRSNFRRRTR